MRQTVPLVLVLSVLAADIQTTTRVAAQDPQRNLTELPTGGTTATLRRLATHAGANRRQARDLVATARRDLLVIVSSRAPSWQAPGGARMLLTNRLRRRGLSTFIEQLAWYQARLETGLPEDALTVIFGRGQGSAEDAVYTCYRILPGWRIQWCAAFVSAASGERVGGRYQATSSGRDLVRSFQRAGFSRRAARRTASELGVGMFRLPRSSGTTGTMRAAASMSLYRACPSAQTDGLERMLAWDAGPSERMALCIGRQFARLSRARAASVVSQLLGLTASDALQFIEWSQPTARASGG